MTIESPKISHVPALRALFAEAFSEGEEFLDLFFGCGYSPARALIATEEEELLGALYWFDCEAYGKKAAYIYGVATAKKHRGQGVSTALMRVAHERLTGEGYSSAILVPAEPSLFDFYSRLGYRKACGISEYEATASNNPIPLREVSTEEYAALRRYCLPEGAVIEEGPILDLLSAGTKLYTGEGVLLAARLFGDRLLCIELLGKAEKAPDILASLGCKAGVFRTVGHGRDFAMFLPLTEEDTPPTYLGIALDI